MLAWGGGSIAELSKEIDAELKNPKNAGLYKTKEARRSSSRAPSPTASR